jgi:hypothetical protein
MLSGGFQSPEPLFTTLWVLFDALWFFVGHNNDKKFASVVVLLTEE